MDFFLQIIFVLWLTVIGLWIKARGLGQGCTRPAGRAPGRPSPRAAGPRAGSKWDKGNTSRVLHHPNRRTVIRLTHHIMANRDIIVHHHFFNIWTQNKNVIVSFLRYNEQTCSLQLTDSVYLFEPLSQDTHWAFSESTAQVSHESLVSQ